MRKLSNAHFHGCLVCSAANLENVSVPFVRLFLLEIAQGNSVIFAQYRTPGYVFMRGHALSGEDLKTLFFSWIDFGLLLFPSDNIPFSFLFLLFFFVEQWHHSIGTSDFDRANAPILSPHTRHCTFQTSICTTHVDYDSFEWLGWPRICWDEHVRNGVVMMWEWWVWQGWIQVTERWRASEKMARVRHM